MSRREFTRNQKEQIVERSKRNGVICCEGCKAALKQGTWEIDHIIAEALRPEADKLKPITIAEGQLLGKDCCHRGEAGKTKQDVKAIAKGKRQYNRANGIKAKKRPIQSAPFPRPDKPDRHSLPVPPAKPMFRRQDNG